ncbi:hypothetical protein [Microseira sp. BLCC-F43]
MLGIPILCGGEDVNYPGHAAQVLSILMASGIDIMSGSSPIFWTHLGER